MTRVLIADKLSPRAAERLTAAGLEVATRAGVSGDALTAALRELDPDVLVVRSTKVQAEHLEAGRALALVIRAGAGVNTIDLATASRRGVHVANCPGKNAIAVAELAMLHLLNCDRRLADATADLRAGRWDKKTYGKGQGLHGRTLAVLGTGPIGREVVRRALAFGMRVVAWSRSLTDEDAAALGVRRADSPLEACRGADALSIHLALAPQTRGLVGREVLAALKPGAAVVNTSRAEVVDEAALAEAVRERGLRAGLDVFAGEPATGEAEFRTPLAELPGVYGTHHIGASTAQAEDAVGDEVVRIVQSFVRTGRVPNCVNLEERSPATHALVVRHEDRVGVLASVLELLREDGINVQEMENVIFQGAAAASARIQIDRAPSDGVLACLDAAPHVLAVSLVALSR